MVGDSRGEVARRPAGLRRAGGVVDHGVFLAVCSMCGDADDHSPRNELLALAHCDVYLHDVAGVLRRAGDVPSRDSLVGWDSIPNDPVRTESQPTFD